MLSGGIGPGSPVTVAVFSRRRAAVRQTHRALSCPSIIRDVRRYQHIYYDDGATVVLPVEMYGTLNSLFVIHATEDTFHIRKSRSTAQRLLSRKDSVN